MSISCEFGYLHQKLNPGTSNKLDFFSQQEVQKRAGQVQPLGNVLHYPRPFLLPALPSGACDLFSWLLDGWLFPRDQSYFLGRREGDN